MTGTRPRGSTIQLRVTDEEKAQIAGHAEATGQTVSEYVRGQALAGPWRPRKKPPFGREAPTLEPSTSSGVVPGGDAHERDAPKTEGTGTPQVAQPEGQEQSGPPADDSPEIEEQFVERRTRELYGQGRILRVARMEAEAEWRAARRGEQ